jgi:flagellar motility protein MotE (MotC chaperone)
MPAPSTPFSRPVRPRFLRAQAEPGMLKQTPVIRLLPVVIAAAIFMLGFRVQVVVRDITGGPTVEVGQAALAQTQGAAPAPGATPAAPAGAPPAAPAAEVASAQGAAPGAPAEDTPPDGGVETGAPPLPINFDPSTLTKSEIDTLQRLAERRDMITQRERELEAKEGLLKAAESRIDGKIGQLQDLEKNIQGLLKQYDGQKQAEIEQLVKIYGAMKPKDAANIFNSLEMPILVAVIQKMKETKVAPIMAAMAPAKATALTEELTVRKQMPSAGGPS